MTSARRQQAGPAIKQRCGAALEEQRIAVRSEDRLRYMRANVSFHVTMIDGWLWQPCCCAHICGWCVLSTSRSAVLAPRRTGQEV
jgi:hypothetical protein